MLTHAQTGSKSTQNFRSPNGLGGRAISIALDQFLNHRCRSPDSPNLLEIKKEINFLRSSTSLRSLRPLGRVCLGYTTIPDPLFSDHHRPLRTFSDPLRPSRGLRTPFRPHCVPGSPLICTYSASIHKRDGFRTRFAFKTLWPGYKYY